MSPNVKKLREIKKAKGAQWIELTRLVPANTLARHLKGDTLPTSIWMARYRLALRLDAEDWLDAKEYKREAKRTHALCFAGRLPPVEPEGALEINGKIAAGVVVKP